MKQQVAAICCNKLSSCLLPAAPALVPAPPPSADCLPPTPVPLRSAPPRSRYDYEECDSGAAGKMMDHVKSVIASSPPGTKFGSFVLKAADDFAYTDPIDGSVAKGQGLRFVFEDGSRIIFRLSGTGSSGATIRLYIEQYTDDKARLLEDAQVRAARARCAVCCVCVAIVYWLQGWLYNLSVGVQEGAQA